jgi:hypothetical protein
VRLGGPLANHPAQLVGLLLQLPHPLRFHGEIAAEFRHLAFNIREFRESRPPLAA